MLIILKAFIYNLDKYYERYNGAGGGGVLHFRHMTRSVRMGAKKCEGSRWGENTISAECRHL